MNLSRKRNIAFFVTLTAVILGFILSMLSFFKACTEACSEAHKYQFFGFPFAAVGIFYFGILLITLLFSKNKRSAFFFASLLLALGIGSEFMFILIQKMHGFWCPLCLGIAANIFIATIAIGYSFIIDIERAVQTHKQKEIMVSIKKSLLSVPTVLVGLLIAFFGVTKEKTGQFEIHDLERQMILGDLNSDIRIYIFTSWTCPACRKLEPRLERMIPGLIELGQVTFVDFGEDMTTLNYLPYNLSFLLHNKDAYVELRHILKEIAESTGAPSEADIEIKVKELGLTYTQLNYSDIATAVEYYKDLAQKYQIQAIPAVVIDRTHKKPVILTGLQITMENIRKAVEEG